jgi:hypothetical protein
MLQNNSPDPSYIIPQSYGYVKYLAECIVTFLLRAMLRFGHGGLLRFVVTMLQNVTFGFLKM